MEARSPRLNRTAHDLNSLQSPQGWLITVRQCELDPTDPMSMFLKIGCRIPWNGPQAVSSQAGPWEEYEPIVQGRIVRRVTSCLGQLPRFCTGTQFQVTSSVRAVDPSAGIDRPGLTMS